MKLFILLAVGLSQASMAAPIYCKGTTTSNKLVSLNVSSSLRTAVVSIDGATLKFGRLACRPLRNHGKPGEPFLACRSTGVADAGFVAYLEFGKSPTNPAAHVSTVSFFGTNPLADLKCVAAVHGR